MDLPLSGTAAVEDRQGGATNDYTLVFSFENTLASVSGASVTGGIATVANSAVGSDPHDNVVNLTNVANGQFVKVTLNGIADSLGNSSTTLGVSLGVLVGDVNGDGFVNSGDSQVTRNRSGQNANTANFRADVNDDRTVNSGDAFIVRSKSGTTLYP